MKYKDIALIILVTIIVAITGCTIEFVNPPLPSPTPVNSPTQTISKYPIHKDITVTIFWVGEGADEDNAFISNIQSAWDDKWMEHYGGIDDPYNRIGYYPMGFIPRENPFYFALPYNDFKEGKRKKEVYDVVYWAKEKIWGEYESMCKNRWIKITKGNKTVYAQWEDVGPFNEDDWPYVFGDSLPQNQINNRAGLDVSPAIRDYLGLSGIDKVDWQFVDEDYVPYGPWKEIITTSGIYWE